MLAAGSPRAIYILSQLTPFLSLLLLCYCHSTYPSIDTPSIPPLLLLLPGHCHSSYLAFATSLSAIAIYLTLTYLTTPLTLPLPFLLHCLCHFSFPAVFPPLTTSVANPLTLPSLAAILPLLFAFRCFSSYLVIATSLTLSLLLLLPCRCHLYHCFSYYPTIATSFSLSL
jgi:hypothetical protein